MATNKAGVRSSIKSKTSKKVAVQQAQETVATSIICPVCKGSKIRELEHGLVQMNCKNCKGTGFVNA